MLQFIILALGIGAYFMLSKWNNAQKLKSYAGYYDKKRREFPWLDKWLKENNFDPSAERVKEEKGVSRTIMIVYYVVVAIITMLFPVWGFYKASIPFQIVLLALPVPASFIWARSKAKDPGDLVADDGVEEGLTLECPSCGCPHAWVMTQKETIIDSESSSSTTTTTTRETTGGGLVGLSESLLHDGTTTKTKTTTTFSGRDIKDFVCLNCKHIEHNEYSWSDVTHPDAGMHIYKPPVQAWTGEAGKKNQEAAANEQYEQAKREEAQKVSAPAPSAQTTNTGAGIPPALLKAAEMGNEDAKYEVGIKYLLGLGVKKDDQKAKEWFGSASGKDLSEDDSEFAYVLWERAQEESSYPKFNYAIAVPLFERVIEEGRYNESSYFFLGQIYADESRNMYNVEKARYWFQQAADEGNSDAKKELKKLK